METDSRFPRINTQYNRDFASFSGKLSAQVLFGLFCYAQMFLQIILTVLDDAKIETHETIELIGIIIVILGYVAQPLLYATTSRYAKACKKYTVDHLENCFECKPLDDRLIN